MLNIFVNAQLPNQLSHTCEYTDCDFVALVEVFTNIIKTFIGFGIWFAGFAVLIAGVYFMSTVFKPEKHNEAKALLKNVLIGFVILLSAWLIVKFIFSILGYKENPFELGPQEITQSSDSSPSDGIPNEDSSNEDSSGGGPADTDVVQTPAQRAIAEREAAAETAGNGDVGNTGEVISPEEAQTLADDNRQNATTIDQARKESEQAYTSEYNAAKTKASDVLNKLDIATENFLPDDYSSGDNAQIQRRQQNKEFYDNNYNPDDATYDSLTGQDSGGWSSPEAEAKFNETKRDIRDYENYKSREKFSAGIEARESLSSTEQDQLNTYQSAAEDYKDNVKFTKDIRKEEAMIQKGLDSCVTYGDCSLNSDGSTRIPGTLERSKNI